MVDATFRLPGAWLRIEAAEPGPISGVRRIYRSFATSGCRTPALCLELLRNGDCFEVVDCRSGRQVAARVRSDQILPRIEHEIHTQLVDLLGDRLLLHAAAVLHGRRVVLLPGLSGSGKTTLAATLVEAGCGYLTDELAILAPRRNLVVPFPKALSVKPGAFPLFAHLRSPGPAESPESVWYLDAEQLRPGSTVRLPAPIGWIVAPRFEPGAKETLERLTTGETTLVLFENAVNLARHKEKGLDRLLAIARRAPGYRLRFGDPRSAGRLLGRMARGEVLQ